LLTPGRCALDDPDQLATAVPAGTLVIAIIHALSGESVGGAIGGAAWMACNIALHVAFWTTLAFALVERGSATADMEADHLGTGLGVDWSPDRLPDVPDSARGSLSEPVTNVAWLGFIGAAIVWQQFRSPIHDAGDRLPMLDPDLWSFWLPLILVLLVAEMGSEVVKYRVGRWTPQLATVNVVLGAVFAAPLVYRAATDKLLTPAAVARIQGGWAGFDPGVANTVVILSALLIWAWDSVDGWRKALGQRPAG
jgi:hypothetical protein